MTTRLEELEGRLERVERDTGHVLDLVQRLIRVVVDQRPYREERGAIDAALERARRAAKALEESLLLGQARPELTLVRPSGGDDDG